MNTKKNVKKRKAEVRQGVGAKYATYDGIMRICTGERNNIYVSKTSKWYQKNIRLIKRLRVLAVYSKGIAFNLRVTVIKEFRVCTKIYFKKPPLTPQMEKMVEEYKAYKKELAKIKRENEKAKLKQKENNNG